MGFTGLMTNGTDNYEALYDPQGVTAGGAASVFTVDTAMAGTALGSANTQQQASNSVSTSPIKQRHSQHKRRCSAHSTV